MMSSLEQPSELRLKSVYIASSLTALAAAALCLFIGYWHISAGIVVGAAISIASLAAIRMLANALTPSTDTKKINSKTRRMRFAALGRYIASGVIIWAAIRYGKADGAGIAVGASLIFLILIIIMLVGSIISETKLNRRV